MPEVQYLEAAGLPSSLRRLPSASQDLIVLITGALNPAERCIEPVEMWKECLDECVRLLREGGLLFVQGRPSVLPEVGVYLDRSLHFRYWIAVESARYRPTHGLPSVHAAILLFSKGERFEIRRVRFPHEYCAFCGRTLRDWGGKSHLMNPQGYAMSDVWKGLPPADNYNGLSIPVLDTILQMVGAAAADPAQEVQGLVIPKEGVGMEASGPLTPSSLPLCSKAGPIEQRPNRSSGSEPGEDELWDQVWQGDVLEVLRRYPDKSVDLAFADPPYNLDKAYHIYEDEREREAYLAWCNAWLEEYIRVLKPTGSLYILNLPHWTMYHAAFLNRHLYFQNWIVWDAVSEPRGKLLPAHYGLLFYTKHPTDFTFNYDEVGSIDARCYCLRSSCIRKRKALGEDRKERLTDIWWDIHRIKHRRHRDYHPCQLPDALLERIIRLSSNPGDIVLDALAGTGTTAVVAARLGRRYVAVDIDPTYVAITREKLAQVKIWGDIYRPPVPRPRPRYNKKALQLELREIALQLGRLPTPEDVRRLSRYGLEAFLEAFPSWGKALKAAKLEVRDDAQGT
ncbi:MAG: DNA methyltransferase [Chloroflexia bacterium]